MLTFIIKQPLFLVLLNLIIQYFGPLHQCSPMRYLIPNWIIFQSIPKFFSQNPLVILDFWRCHMKLWQMYERAVIKNSFAIPPTFCLELIILWRWNVSEFFSPDQSFWKSYESGKSNINISLRGVLPTYNSFKLLRRDGSNGSTVRYVSSSPQCLHASNILKWPLGKSLGDLRRCSYTNQVFFDDTTYVGCNSLTLWDNCQEPG